MDIITVNVGQGALAIVRHRNEAVIVDTSIPPSGNYTVEYVKGFLAKYLANHYLKGLILTGFDNDHAAADGVSIILKKYRPDWIMYPKYYKDTQEAGRVFGVIKQQEEERTGTNRPLRRLSVRVDTVSSRFLTGLSPVFSFELFSPHLEDMDSSNNSSIVCKISGLGFDSFSYLVTGDTECGRWESITRLFGRNLASQVMAAPHHGSRNGVDPKSLLLISPQVVLISAGVDNQYGHPNSQAVTAYSRVAKVYATNANRGTSFITLLDPAGKIETNPISAATSESVSAASLLRSLRGLA